LPDHQGAAVSGRRLRAAAAPLWLVGARLRTAPGRPALVALGIAVAVALLGSAAGAGTSSGERAARQTLADLPPDQRDLSVVWSNGLTPGVARRARSTLRSLTPAAQSSSVLFLTTRLTAGGRAQVAAIRPLGRWLRLTSGRMPRMCSARRCEVVQVGGSPAPATLARQGTTLAVVGHGALTSRVPLGFVPTSAAAGEREANGRPPVLVGGDPDALDDADGFSTVFRSHGWSAALDLGTRPSWQLDALRERIERTANALNNVDESFSLRAPTDALRASADRAKVARRRMLLVGAGAASLLSAFALLAAGLMRRDLEAERARLRRRGARRGQLLALDAGEALAPALAGVVLGGLAAIAVTALRARGEPVPAGTVLGHALLSTGAIAIGLGCALVATVLIIVGSRGWGPGGGRAADVAAFAAVVALAVVLSRGGARAGDAGDPLPVLLVPMTLLVAALVVARAAPAVLRAIEHAARRGPLPVRLAALGPGRGSGGAAVTIALVALACALACFAGAYRATLHRGAADEAAFRVPLDVSVRQAGQSPAPLAAASAARWRAVAGGGPVLPVLRRSGTVPGAQAAISVLGVPGHALGDLRAGGDERVGAGSAKELAGRLTGPDSRPPGGVRLSADPVTLQLRAHSVGDALDLVADVVAPNGSLQAVSLGRADPSARTVRTRLPAGPRGRRLVAIEAAEPSGLAATAGHARAESPVGSTTTQGRLVLGELRVGSDAVRLSGWCAAGALRAPVARGSATVVPFAFDVGGRPLLRPCPPAGSGPVPILADRVTARSAGRGGRLAVVVDGTLVRARVVGTLARMPTVASGDAFVVADEQALASALTAAAPGSAQPDELWIGAGTAGEARLRAALRRPPVSGLELESRRALLGRLNADPLAHELSRTLIVAAVASLVLAAAAVLLAALVAVRDEGAELYELEAAGADPAMLLAGVRLRAALLAALGMLAGVVVGLALLTLLVDAVQVTATGRAAFPPLVVVVPWVAWLVGACAFALGCAALVAAGTARALRGSVPRRSAAVAP
jgi:hypothetical protein